MKQITAQSHPYRVKIFPDMFVAFPASMTLDQIEAACKKLQDKQGQSKKRKTRKADHGSAALGATQEDL
jgi:hypothetical protein